MKHGPRRTRSRHSGGRTGQPRHQVVIDPAATAKAGTIIANCRNKKEDQMIRTAAVAAVFDTDVDTFGALLWDGWRIGAGLVFAPSAIRWRGLVVPHLGHVDQAP